MWVMDSGLNSTMEIVSCKNNSLFIIVQTHGITYKVSQINLVLIVILPKDWFLF